MKRFKLLLVAAMGALALMASAGPASASASGIAFGSYPATANATEVGVHTLGLSAGRNIACTLSSFTASADGPSETLTATVTPTGCSSEFEGSMTLKMNGCKFIYHPAMGTGSLDIGPVGCGPITLESTNCTRAFAPQTGLSASFANEGTSPKSVKVTDSAILQYTVTKGSKAYCGGGTQTASLTGSWLLKGFNPGGVQIDAKVVPGTGVYMTGEESGEAAKQPKFAAETYPTTLTGFQDPSQKQVLTIGGNRSLECAEVTAKGVASAASAQLALGMEYATCAVTVLGNVFSTSVNTNGCNLTLNALNVGPPYSASVGIACAKEGAGVELSTYSEGTHICTYKLSPQSGLSGVSLSNVGSGTERGIAATFNVSGISVTRTKGTLAACGGASQSATYTGATTFHGVS